ncbi:hypothetical protein [Aquihabitans sp. McL0605]|uniref:hypothetical protein n=1 Tax=Aquihabitans sp. McL0605 TaxID=3415671 RepID=UPI003CF4DFE3
MAVVAAWKVALPDRRAWKLQAAPLTGLFDRHLTPLTLTVLALGLVLARTLPGWCRRGSWRQVLVATAVVALGWGMALAVTRGVDGLDRGSSSPHDYPAVVAQVDRVGVRSFVDTFTQEPVLRTYPIHVQGHPVGAALLFVGLDRVGLGGPRGAAAFTLLVSATAVVAVLLAVREVAGADAARRVAPFLALMPGVVWWVVSADALFATVAAWGIALAVLATRPGATPRRRAVLALGSGALWGIGVNLSYGLAPLVLVAIVVVVARRCWAVLGWAALGGAAVVAAFAAGGFWWFDGLAATKVRYDTGVAQYRPAGYFRWLGNPAAFGLAIGPAAWVAVLRVKDRGLALLAGPALLAVAIADATGLSKAEVERIWLPFAPWVLVLAGGLVDRPAGPARRSSSPGWPALASGLLVVQVVVAVAVETFVKTPW